MDTRGKVIEIIRGHESSKNEKDEEFGIQLPEMPDLTIDIPKEEVSSTSSGPKLYVRDDGTVDWDGALQDRAALKMFGSAVWARINGRNADDITDDDDIDTTKGSHGGHDKPAVTVKIEDTPEILKARDELIELKQNLSALQQSHTALLNSGISAGQAVANVNLASLNPELRTKIRLSAEALNSMEQQVSFQTLVYELERIYTYLATELGNPLAKGYVPLQDRLNVAEYGLLESQVEGCHRDLEAKGAVDEDILAVIAEQMTDFKRRLGIDYYVSGLTYDKEAIQTWLNDVLIQTKTGVAFYVKGCRLFWNDVLYCGKLIARAAQGYTLKPREVRNLRYVSLAVVLAAEFPTLSYLCVGVPDRQAHLQGPRHLHSIHYHPHHSFDTDRACFGFRCHSTVLPRLLSKLLYRATAKFAKIIRDNRIFRVYD